MGRAHWGPAHLRWLAEVGCPTPAQHLVLHAYVRAVTEHTERRGRLDPERRAPGPTWRVHPVVDALQAWRGGPGPVAVTLVADSGACTRCEPPSALMQLLG